MAVAYLATYLVLEWATFRADVSPLGITPWNPAAGLSLALLLVKGPRWAPLLALALLLADMLVRHVAFPAWVELAEIAVTVAGYTPVAMLLRRPQSRFDRSLGTMRDLSLFAAAAVAAAMLVSIGYVGVLHVAGLLPAHEIFGAVLRHWGGDVIGILAVTPILLLAASGAARLRPTFEVVLQGLTILAAVAIVLGGGGGVREQLFYLLFLPVVWIGVRHGLPGASAGLFVMQVGLMIALHARSTPVGDIVALQAVLLILLFAGLAIGVLTSESMRAASHLRRQQMVLARLGRAVGMGSLSTSLAHEISQPLTAIGNYAGAAARALKTEPPQIEQAREATGKVTAQVVRAADIVRKLRGLFEVGRVEPVHQDSGALIAESVGLVAVEAAEHGVHVEAATAPAAPAVLADRTQIVLVLVNLLRNSIESLEAVPGPRRIEVSTQRVAPNKVVFAVADNGPGFSDDFDLATHGPGQSIKPHGLGVGLTLCRSIIEAHGGRLEIGRRSPGAEVRFTLTRSGGDDAETT